MSSFNCESLLEREKANLIKCLKIPTNKFVAILLTTKDIPSKKYVALKTELLKNIGINTVTTVQQGATRDVVNKWVEQHNNNKDCLAIIVQYPVSSNNRDEVANLIQHNKDIDALSRFWFDKLVSKESNIQKMFLPPTAYGCLEIIKEQGINGNVAVIGESLLTGQPIKLLLQKVGFSVYSCNEKTSWEEKKNIVSKSRIVVSTVGRNNVIDEKWINEHHLIIDFGRRYENNKALGDIDLTKINDKCQYTSTYKSTGYATLAGILRNIRIKLEGNNYEK